MAKNLEVWTAANASHASQRRRCDPISSIGQELRRFIGIAGEIDFSHSTCLFLFAKDRAIVWSISQLAQKWSRHWALILLWLRHSSLTTYRSNRWGNGQTWEAEPNGTRAERT
jgi:hypothetical protein